MQEDRPSTDASETPPLNRPAVLKVLLGLAVLTILWLVVSGQDADEEWQGADGLAVGIEGGELPGVSAEVPAFAGNLPADEAPAFAGNLPAGEAPGFAGNFPAGEAPSLIDYPTDPGYGEGLVDPVSGRYLGDDVASPGGGYDEPGAYRGQAEVGGVPLVSGTVDQSGGGNSVHSVGGKVIELP